jgi:hypothetical protein
VEILNRSLKILEQWVAYFGYCIEHPLQAPVCRPFWTWTMIGLFAIGALGAIIVIWKIISYKLKLAAALRAQAKRERVDHDAIEGRRWNGDTVYSADLGQVEVERRIRETVYKQHMADSAKADKLNIV